MLETAPANLPCAWTSSVAADASKNELSVLEVIMFKKTITAPAMVIIAGLVLLGAMQVIAGAQQKAAVPKPQDKLAIAEEQAKQLMLLIDTEKKGKISKQEWMKFMEAEFDRLDKNKNGELDVEELTQSRLRARHFLTAGK
jgi:hypothetical protein